MCSSRVGREGSPTASEWIYSKSCGHHQLTFCSGLNMCSLTCRAPAWSWANHFYITYRFPAPEWIPGLPFILSLLRKCQESELRRKPGVSDRSWNRIRKKKHHQKKSLYLFVCAMLWHFRNSSAQRHWYPRRRRALEPFLHPGNSLSYGRVRWWTVCCSPRR